MKIFAGLGLFVLLIAYFFILNRKLWKSGAYCPVCKYRYMGMALECECTNWGLKDSFKE
jgi:hypothetical protein